jgi:hypothetical protein
MAGRLLSGQLGRTGEPAVAAQPKDYAGICVDGLREIEMSLSMDPLRLGRDSNLTLPEQDG